MTYNLNQGKNVNVFFNIFWKILMTARHTTACVLSAEQNEELTSGLYSLGLLLLLLCGYDML